MGISLTIKNTNSTTSLFKSMDTTIFDLETASLDREQILLEAEPFDPESVKTGNIKDPEIKAAKKRDAMNAYYQGILDRAALDARTGKVLCAGFYYPYKNEYSILEGAEIEVLTGLWLHLKYQEKHVGFNILGFDLPFAVRRSWHLGVPVPVWVFNGRYFASNFVDLMKYWQLGDNHDYISLDRFAKFVGLKGKSHDSKDFGALYAKDHDDAIEYVKNDLCLTADIARRLMV